MTNWRERCATLIDKIDYTWGDIPDDALALIDRTRAELAHPDPEGPTDMEVIAFWSEHCAGDGDAGILRLARFGRPAQPEPETSRLRYCDVHGQQPENAWGCPECVREMRHQLAQPAPDGPSHWDVCQWLEQQGHWGDNAHRIPRIANMVQGALARWGRPAIEPVPTPEPGTADHITDDEGHRWDRTMDAALWAKAFCLICPEMASREDVMIGWFANAIMAGCDHQAWKMDAERKPVPVSERPILKSSDFNDAEGRCWCGTTAFTDERGDLPIDYPMAWELREPCAQDDCVVPHWALPVPVSLTS